MPIDTEPKEFTFKLYPKDEIPPIGIEPWFTFYSERIEDLIDALSRYKVKDDMDTLIKWARELQLVCKLYKELDND